MLYLVYKPERLGVDYTHKHIARSTGCGSAGSGFFKVKREISHDFVELLRDIK